MERREFLMGIIAGGLALLGRPGSARAAGWADYANLGIKAGAERCAIIGKDGATWASVNSSGAPYQIKVRDLKTLIQDAIAKKNSTELNFDGTKFFSTSVVEDTLMGKAKDYACAVKATDKTIVVVIQKGTPQSTLASLTKVVGALQSVKM